MDILRMLYGEVGVPFPTISLIVAAVLGAIGMGGLWYLLGRDYDRHQPAISWADRSKQTPPPKEPQSIVVAPETIPSVKPVPSLESSPHKTSPPVIKKDIPIKTKETVPDKPDKPIETAPIEATPIQPKEKLHEFLAEKYKAGGPGLEQGTEFFMHRWIQALDRVRVRRMKHDLKTVLSAGGNLRIPEISPEGQITEAIFTLQCLEKEEYIKITETTERLAGIGKILFNFEFEFVPEKINEFVEGL